MHYILFNFLLVYALIKELILNQMKRILLLGGTGAMGTHLQGCLASKGYRVFVTSRSRQNVNNESVLFLTGDSKDNSFLAEILSKTKPDAIVDFMNYGTIEFMNRRNKLLNKTGQYVFISSCRVFAGEDVHVEKSPRLLDVVNDDVYLKTDEYGLAKAREEDLLRESGYDNWTIVRPCITYSSPRFQFGCLEAGTFLARALQGLHSLIPEEMLDKRTTMMWGGDVAEIISRLLFNDRALGEDFNTVTSENHTWREVGEIYAKLIGLKYKTCSIQDYTMICNPYQVKYGRMVDHVFDNSKVLDVTQMRQQDFKSLQDGLKIEIEKFLENKLLVADIEKNAYMDRILHTRFNVGGGWRERMIYECARHRRLGRLGRLFVC